MFNSIRLTNCRNLRSMFLALVVMLVASQCAVAQYLLQIDVSNPNAVVFTATNGLSSSNDSSSVVYDGISVINFFTSDDAFIDYQDPDLDGDWAFISSNWSPSGTTAVYDSIGTFNFEVSVNWGKGNDLCVNGFQNYSTQVFGTTQTAFSGSAIKDMAGGKQDNSAYLPTIGATGDIVVGYEASNPVIGQWVIVPEPATISMFAFGIAGFLRRRKNNR